MCSLHCRDATIKLKRRHRFYNNNQLALTLVQPWQRERNVTRCVFLTLLGLLVEVSESHWLLCGERSTCHLAPWSNVTTVSTTPSAKPI